MDNITLFRGLSYELPNGQRLDLSNDNALIRVNESVALGVLSESMQASQPILNISHYQETLSAKHGSKCGVWETINRTRSCNNL